jgi:hypothetical protein
MSGTAEVIQFAAFRKVGKTAVPRERRIPKPQGEEEVSETGKNFRLRQERRENWREADAVMEYWHVSMKMDGAISRVQNHELPEGKLHPIREPGHYWALIAKYREAWARLMLTPAPDMLSVTWKRAQLEAGNYQYTDLKPERITRAIADDVEFLRTHPTRRNAVRAEASPPEN